MAVDRWVVAISAAVTPVSVMDRDWEEEVVSVVDRDWEEGADLGEEAVVLEVVKAWAAEPATTASVRTARCGRTADAPNLGCSRHVHIPLRLSAAAA